MLPCDPAISVIAIAFRTTNELEKIEKTRREL
jgi:hypothetical protein